MFLIESDIFVSFKIPKDFKKSKFQTRLWMPSLFHSLFSGLMVV